MAKLKFGLRYAWFHLYDTLERFKNPFHSIRNQVILRSRMCWWFSSLKNRLAGWSQFIYALSLFEIDPKSIVKYFSNEIVTKTMLIFNYQMIREKKKR